MDGLAFVQMVEIELKRRRIPKEQFYRESGISSATMSQWRKRIYSPSSAAIKKIEDYLGVIFTIEQKGNKKAPTENGERDILDDVDVAFYGDFKELNEDEKETVRDMVRLMRQRKEKRSQ
ncbi:MAG: helix-turn-helix transcriptional regulator [Oscillospiraceae bacterium]|nr:helix-turn-helix transcriptional regulator [Oscillospiraceae bacterium]